MGGVANPASEEIGKSFKLSKHINLCVQVKEKRDPIE